MKILHINTNSTGGAATAAIRLHKALLKQGHDSKMLFLRGTGLIENGFYWDFPNKVAIKESLSKRISKKISRILREFLPYRFQKRNRPIIWNNAEVEIFTSPITDFHIHEHPLVKDADIIQLHWVADFLNWESFFKNITKPVFWYFHDMNPILGGLHYSNDLLKIPNSELENLEKKFNSIKENSLLSIKNLCIQCDSNWLKREVIKSGRFVNAKYIETIHYSLDFTVFYPLDKQNIKKNLGINSDYTVILFGCENLQNKRKGLDLLIEAIKLLEQKKKIILCTFGGGVDVSNEIGGKFIIKNFGKITNPELQRIIYSTADFFIIPSRQEAFGQTALESLACGTPVIGYNVGGIPDIIMDEVNGLLVDNITARGLQESILRLIEDKELLNKLTNASRNSVELKFSQEKQSDALVMKYSEQLNKIKSYR